MAYGLLVIGLGLLLVGAELLLRGAVGLAERLGLSPLLIGLTVVAWGTSAPELTVSLNAALGGLPDITLGNVVGSNIFNVLAILGIAALVKPIECQPRAIARDATLGLVAALAVLGLAQVGAVIGPGVGAAFVGAIVLYTGVAYVMERRPRSATRALVVGEVAEVAAPIAAPMAALVFLIGIGLAALILGSNLLVDNAVLIARRWGVSEAVIGLTLVAAGTSLPELATSVVAAIRGQSEIAIGNVLGSNLMNILAIVGLTATIVPVPIAPRIAAVDSYVLVGVALAAMLPLFTGGRIGRPMALAFLLAYGAYTVLALGQGGYAG